MRGITQAIVGGVCALTVATGALGQVSFVTVPVQSIAPSETRVLDTNAACTLALLETPVPLQPHSTRNRDYSVVRPNGSQVTRWGSVDWNPASAVNDAGTAVWAHSTVLGTILRATSLITVESKGVEGTPCDVSGDERFVVGFTYVGSNLMPIWWDRDTDAEPTLFGGTPGRPYGVIYSTTQDGAHTCGFTEERGVWSAVNPIATTWTSAGTATALPLPAGMTASIAYRVDGMGGAVGYSLAGDQGPAVPTQWLAGGGVRLLPMAGVRGYTTGVSRDGRVVSGYVMGPSPAGPTVWIDGVAHNLRAYLLELGVTGLDGWNLNLETCLSQDGRRICGTASNEQGGCAVYFATLPGVCAADLGKVGGLYGNDGVLDNNDFVAFIDEFFTGNASSDLGSAGGVPGGDGVLDNNDFIAFVDFFFAGCA